MQPNRFPCFLAVKKIIRAYGGPEEGGWYYNASTIFYDVHPVYTQEACIAAITKLCTTHELKASLPGRNPTRWDSSESAEYSLWIGYTMPRSHRQPRPYYE